MVTLQLAKSCYENTKTNNMLFHIHMGIEFNTEIGFIFTGESAALLPNQQVPIMLSKF